MNHLAIRVVNDEVALETEEEDEVTRDPRVHRIELEVLEEAVTTLIGIFNLRPLITSS